MCPENPLQNGFFLPYRMVRFGAQKNYYVFSKKCKKKISHTVFTTKWHPRPHFFHRMEDYSNLNPSHSVEEMARGIVLVHFDTCMKHAAFFALLLFRTLWVAYGLQSHT